MNIHDALTTHSLILTEAAVLEPLRRSGAVQLHPLLEHALLIYDDAGRQRLTALYESYISVAQNAGVPIAVCTPTWRANPDRIARAGTKSDVNRDAVAYLDRLRSVVRSRPTEVFIGGLVGCKNDCYKPEQGLSTNEARTFHRRQINELADAGVDFLIAQTLPAVPEALGIALAMAETDTPYIISFVIDSKGRILDGTTLEEAFTEIDSAPGRPPLGFMINCAYPSFLNAHEQPETVLKRLVGYQANASSRDHSELDGSDSLLADDLEDWGNRMIELNNRYGIKILGGCCGTGREHLEFIVQGIE
jgi:S-methylmethionine-dependent homocysteine/selenocysteine methylase